ncbi:phospholipid-transporting ATPase ABCA1-like [Zeugodacus cucurbitae]|uniref:phospholipid-transporting ATPase ABCA1-like n=1 Tax=Zeugodacus cucurbitae TaxID=28588 RepID=UPI0023D95297|nr:phospholipid-transporting ATPase ABCA1-like [Zeugodacus cucurbitae]
MQVKRIPSETSALSTGRSEEDLQPTNYNWLRFKWLFWKDCFMHWNTRWEFLFALFMPSLCALIVIILRFNISAEHITAMPFKIENLEQNWGRLLDIIAGRQSAVEKFLGTPSYNVYAPRIMIAYAPDFEAIVNIMALTTDLSLNPDQYIRFKTCAELREKMTTEYYLAGICFREDVFNIESESIYKIGLYPNRLEYQIIFPSELRLYKGYIGETWDTRYLFPNVKKHERHMGFVPYIGEGFIMLQKTISEAYINLTCNKSLTEELFLRRFPIAEHYYDPLSEGLEQRLSLVLAVAYICTMLYLLRILINEREAQLHSLLAIFDVTYFIQFYSWFVFSLISISIGTILLLIILKIPWNHGFGVFHRSSFTCLFALFTAFNINTLSYCYMIFKVFRNSDMAICAAPIIWIMLYAPFAIGNQTSPLSEMLHPYISLLGNTAFALALQHLFRLQSDDGLNWSNFFRTGWQSEHYSIGSYALIMCGTSIIQALVGIFAPIIGRTFTKLTKPFSRKTERVRLSTDSNRFSKTIIFEVRANYKAPAIDVVALTVQIGYSIVLEDLSFSLYEDEITMLMGHNGSGKTTLLEVIAGFKRPTSGKIDFKGDTLSKEYGSPRDFIGICFSDSLLFCNLYVKHQLMLFGRLKGINPIDLNKEVNKYLSALELEDEQYTLTEQLTCGQRTRLAVACALIGGSRVVLLDDVVLKLDVRDYKLIWKLLEREKFGRVIMVSTNLSREPEVHADNIIMLSQGRLSCAGTAQFLKTMYCFGCHLLISKSEECKSEKVTQLLSKYIPDIVASCDLVLELSYHIESSNVEVLETVIKALENAKEELAIVNITIIETPVEELFCKLGAELPAYDDRRRYYRIFNGQSIVAIDFDDDALFMSAKIKYNANVVERLFNQWSAVFYKLLIIQSTYFVLAVIVLPLFGLFFCGIIMIPHLRVVPKMDNDINDYKDSITLLSVPEQPESGMQSFVETYNRYMYWRNSNIKIKNIKHEFINDYILKLEREKQETHLNVHTILGLSVRNHVVGWFNGYIPSVAPILLDILHNVYLWDVLNTTNAKINVSLDLLPTEGNVNLREITQMHFNMGSRVALHLALLICYLLAVRSINLVSERESGFESLQRLAGLSGINYWISIFIFDVIRFAILFSIFTFMSWAILPTANAPPIVFRWCFGMTFLASIAVVMTNYLLSALFFKNSFGAYLKMTSLHAIGIVFFIVFSRDFKPYADKLYPLPRIFPLYSFCRAIENLYEYNILHQVCNIDNIKTASVVLGHCQRIPDCCEPPKISVNDDLFYLWVIIAVCWFGLFIYEYRSCFQVNIPFDNYERALDEYKRRHASDAEEADNVTAEAIHVQTLRPRLRYYYTVICENLGYFWKGKILVDRLSFTIKPGEKFGIVGTNCNYTNSLLRLIAGQYKPSFGRVCINSVQMTEERKKALANIGYVPTVAFVQPQMTCYQVLKIFCILYGYPRHEINDILEDFTKHFGLHSHYHMRLTECSSGIRERISYALAILKKPALLCIGNFSWSVDPHGRRQLYRLIDGLRKRGTAIAITSVMNSYTEILCTKIGVMHEGRLLHIGAPEQIANEIVGCYSVSMRMKKQVHTPHGVTLKVYFRLTAFMEKTFPYSRLVQEGTVMQYVIPHQSTTLAIIFRTLRLNSFQLNIESLSITTLNMNYIFEQITEEAIKASKKY